MGKARKGLTAALLGTLLLTTVGANPLPPKTPEDCLGLPDESAQVSCYLDRQFPQMDGKAVGFYTPLILDAEKAAGEKSPAPILDNLYYVGPQEMAKVLYACTDGPGKGTCRGYEEYNTGLHYVEPDGVVTMVELGRDKLTFEGALSDSVAFDKAAAALGDSYARITTLDQIRREFDRIIPYLIKDGFITDAHGANDIYQLAFAPLPGALGATGFDENGAFIYFDTQFMADPAMKPLVYLVVTHEFLHGKALVLNEAKTQMSAIAVGSQMAQDGLNGYRAGVLSETSEEALWTADYIMYYGQEPPADADSIPAAVEAATGRFTPMSRRALCAKDDLLCKDVNGAFDSGVRAYREALLDSALDTTYGSSGDMRDSVEGSLRNLDKGNDAMDRMVIQYKIIPYSEIALALEGDGVIRGMHVAPYYTPEGKYRDSIDLDVRAVGAVWEAARAGGK